ncbi:MAG: bacterial transcriptional activator domain-containing protein, partial [Actinomycetota bacterium]
GSMLEPDRKGTAPFFLRTDPGGRVMLHPDPMLVIDVWRFDELVVEGFRLDSTGLARQAAETLAEAADVYGGELLGGSVPGLWAELESERLRSAFIRCVGRAGELLVAAGQTDRANELCRRGLLADEWSESLHRLRAGCFLAQGDRTAARRALERALAVVTELGVEPEPETEFLARSLGLTLPRSVDDRS